MFDKILVPLDGSKESEGILPRIKDELSPEGQMILLRVIPPSKSKTIAGQVIPASQLEETDRDNAIGYLRRTARDHDLDEGRFQCEAAINSSVGQGIVDFAQYNQVDLIAMYTHDRKGLGGFLKKSVSKEVQKRSPVQVRVIKPADLVAAG